MINVLYYIKRLCILNVIYTLAYICLNNLYNNKLFIIIDTEQEIVITTNIYFIAQQFKIIQFIYAKFINLFIQYIFI